MKSLLIAARTLFAIIFLSPLHSVGRSPVPSVGRNMVPSMGRSPVSSVGRNLAAREARSPVGQKHFDFNDNCRQAYRQIIHLKLDEGQRLLDAEKKRDPDNLIPAFLENYIDFFILFFNEDPAEYKIRKNRPDERIDLMDEGPSSSPFYLFTKSVIHFQWAAVQVKFGNNWSAAWEFRRSFLQSRENQQKFPGFAPAGMLSGAMQIVAGTIPDGYRWLSSLLGIRGNIAGGMKLLDNFLRLQDDWAELYREEATFYFLYLKFYIENQREQVFAYIKGHNLDLKNNLLFTYMAANLAVNDQQAAYAVQIIRARNCGKEYLPLSVWDLEMGYASLYHLEVDAYVYLERFIQTFKGHFYVKDVLQKLSWFYYLRGDQAKADWYREQTMSKGTAECDADRQAMKEAVAGRWPDRTLLKARLLSDGGYYTEALGLLQGVNTGNFGNAVDKCEYTYRLGRIYDGLGREDEAIAAYRATVQSGSQLKEYFAARAALQAGYLYERRGDRRSAIACFQQCLDLKDHDYKNSLDQKAKAGIARCKGE